MAASPAPAPVGPSHRGLILGTVAAVVVILGVALFVATRPNTTTTASGGDGGARSDASGAAPGPSASTGAAPGVRASDGVAPSSAAAVTTQSTPTTQPAPTTSTTAPPSAVTAIRSGELAFDFTHPAWGRVTLATHDDNANGPAWFTVTGAGGNSFFRYDSPSMYVLRPAGAVTDGTGSRVPSPVDKAGHIFLDYNPGRYNGVIILSPTATGFENFRTLSASGDYATRFYSGVAKDVDGDGTYEVEVTTNDCTPSCAAGTNSVQSFHWNGSDYVPT